MPEIKLDKYDQIGIVVKDIEKAADLYRGFFNFKGSINVIKQNASVVYKGKKVTLKMKKIMQFFGDKQFEIVEVLEASGPNLYSEFIKQGNTGIHHLGVYLKKVDVLINHLKNEFKIDVIQTGKVGRVKFYYLDTKDILGYYLELIAF